MQVAFPVSYIKILTKNISAILNIELLVMLKLMFLVELVKLNMNIISSEVIMNMLKLGSIHSILIHLNNFGSDQRPAVLKILQSF